MRAVTSREIGIESPEREAVADTGRSGRVLFVDNRPASHERIAAMLAEGQCCVDVEADPSEALFRAADGNYDLLIAARARVDCERLGGGIMVNADLLFGGILAVDFRGR